MTHEGFLGKSHESDGSDAATRDDLGRFTSGQTYWTVERAIAAVRSFHERHGYQPVCDDGGRWNELPTWGTARRLFGSWNAMIEAAGFRPYPPRNSALGKVLAYRDRHPDWRQTLSDKTRRRLLLRHEEAA